MRRLVIALCLSLTLLATAVSTVLADPVPAENLPTEACDSAARGRSESSTEGNVPSRHTEDTFHACHVHYPDAFFENRP